MTTSAVFERVFDPVQFDVDPGKTALIVVDMQYLDAHRDYGMGADAKRKGLWHKFTYFFDQLESIVVPNIARILTAARKAQIQIFSSHRISCFRLPGC